MLCREERCLQKCEICGLVIAPPGKCRCGHVVFDTVSKGMLESYMIKHVGIPGFVVIPKQLYGDFWIVERRPVDVLPLKRMQHVLYYSDGEVDANIVESAVDKIQVLNLTEESIIPRIVDKYYRKGGKLNHYTVSFYVHQEIRHIADKFDVPIVKLLTAFVNYMLEVGV